MYVMSIRKEETRSLIKVTSLQFLNDVYPVSDKDYPVCKKRKSEKVEKVYPTSDPFPKQFTRLPKLVSIIYVDLRE